MSGEPDYGDVVLATRSRPMLRGRPQPVNGMAAVIVARRTGQVLGKFANSPWCQVNFVTISCWNQVVFFEVVGCTVAPPNFHFVALGYYSSKFLRFGLRLASKYVRGHQMLPVGCQKVIVTMINTLSRLAVARGWGNCHFPGTADAVLGVLGHETLQHLLLKKRRIVTIFQATYCDFIASSAWPTLNQH